MPELGDKAWVEDIVAMEFGRHTPASSDRHASGKCLRRLMEVAGNAACCFRPRGGWSSAAEMTTKMEAEGILMRQVPLISLAMLAVLVLVLGVACAVRKSRLLR